jgi:hypothetical protein
MNMIIDNLKENQFTSNGILLSSCNSTNKLQNQDNIYT